MVRTKAVNPSGVQLDVVREASEDEYSTLVLYLNPVTRLDEVFLELKFVLNVNILVKSVGVLPPLALSANSLSYISHIKPSFHHR